MDLLEQIKDTASAAKRRSSLFYILAIVILILITFATIRLSSTFRKGIELDIRDEYAQQIAELEDQLEVQKKSYDEELSKVNKDHTKELEKKSKKISELEASIADLESTIEELTIKIKISFDEIETDIKTVGKLTTIDYRYTYAGTHTDTAKFFKWMTKNSFIAQWEGVVAIGVDMSKVKISVNETSKLITVSIPSAEIFYHDVDEDSFEVLDKKNNVFNPITVEDKVNFDKEYEQRIYTKINDSGLMSDASDNAKMIIGNILNSVPGLAEQYQIQYKTIR